MAHGIDKGDVAERGQVKSISRDVTFEEDVSNPEVVFDALDKLSEDVIADAQRQKLFFKTVTIRVRYENFETHTHGRTLPLITNRLQDLKKTSRELMQSYIRPDRKIRLVSVRVSNFTSSQAQKTLI